jgi:uncharacterized BrkB/YihY/UPF0761 family membrane protein
MSLNRLWRRVVSPRSWSVTLRRAFLLTLPVAIPLWTTLVAGLVIALTVRSVGAPLSSFWNDPPRKYRSLYDASRRDRGGDDDVLALPNFADERASKAA